MHQINLGATSCERTVVSCPVSQGGKHQMTERRRLGKISKTRSSGDY